MLSLTIGPVSQGRVERVFAALRVAFAGLAAPAGLAAAVGLAALRGLRVSLVVPPAGNSAVGLICPSAVTANQAEVPRRTRE